MSRILGLTSLIGVWRPAAERWTGTALVLLQFSLQDSLVLLRTHTRTVSRSYPAWPLALYERRELSLNRKIGHCYLRLTVVCTPY
ncbi:hypothetical protein EDD85DRAFT_870193 [Armillaria nabsnona]|nr:hypothetical protein EDD85DRAFT_870193 [Armillaria nabsnona]